MIRNNWVSVEHYAIHSEHEDEGAVREVVQGETELEVDVGCSFRITGTPRLLDLIEDRFTGFRSWPWSAWATKIQDLRDLSSGTPQGREGS